MDMSLGLEPPKSSGYSSLTLASTDVALKNLDNYLEVEAEAPKADVKVEAPKADVKLDVEPEPVDVSLH